MPTYTATLVVVVTAHLPSEREFRRHCARWLTTRGKLRVERWELEQIGAVPHVPPGKFLVHLCTLGNPNHGQYAPVSEPRWHVVASLKEARDKCAAYLEQYDGLIGGGNWGPHSGEVTNSRGTVIAKFSYNLRCWSPTGAELPCLEAPPGIAPKMPKQFIVLGPDGIPIRERPFASRGAAEGGIKEFVERFRVQGYSRLSC